MKKFKVALLSVVITGLLSACAIIPKPLTSIQAYDLGTLQNRKGVDRQRLPKNIVLGRITAVPWLLSKNIYYRFLYIHRTQLNQYTRSQWLAPPASLLSERLISTTNNHSNKSALRPNDRLQLNLKLLRFEQIFTGPNQSHGLLEIQASLSNLDSGEILRQRIFRLDHSSATPNAAGAVRALSMETNEFIKALIRWLRSVQIGNRGS